jgi:hypothetical protein
MPVFKKIRENDGFAILNDFLTNLDQKQLYWQTKVKNTAKYHLQFAVFRRSFCKGPSPVHSDVNRNRLLLVFKNLSSLEPRLLSVGTEPVLDPGQETPQYGGILMRCCQCDIAIRSKDRIGGRSVKRARPQGPNCNSIFDTGSGRQK